MVVCALSIVSSTLGWGVRSRFSKKLRFGVLVLRTRLGVVRWFWGIGGLRIVRAGGRGWVELMGRCDVVES